MSSNLKIMASVELIAHSPSQCLIFHLTHLTSIFFQASRHRPPPVAIARETEHSGKHARGMSRNVFCPPRSRRGGAWLLCGLHTRHVGHIAFSCSLVHVHRESPEKKNAFWGGCVLDVAGCVFFLRTRTACCKYEAGLPHLPLY